MTPSSETLTLSTQAAPGAVPRLGVVVGAMRAGTTTLYQLLQQSGLVSLSRIKEPDFFIAEKSAYRGAAWYAGLYDDVSKVCVDISPNYAKNDVFPGVAEAIHRYNPAARIVYVVREPVDRAVSEYFHQKASGAAMPSPDQLLDTPQGRHILSTSSYGKQLTEFQAWFPPEQILLVDMQRLVREPESQLSAILAFLGVELAGPLSLTATAANDRASLERMPKAWLALRRTRLGDVVRGLVPPAWHARLKSMGGSLAPEKKDAAPEVFPDSVREAIRRELEADLDLFRQRAKGLNCDWL